MVMVFLIPKSASPMRLFIPQRRVTLRSLFNHVWEGKNHRLLAEETGEIDGIDDVLVRDKHVL